jgi:membrane-associated HD superfamily phosphohydrolase
MLADAVEAADRVLEDPTPPKIEKMVARQVRAKMEADQLDECPLTLAEIDLIQRTLTSSLNSAHHQRIKYPEQIPEEAQVLLEKLPEEERDASGLHSLLQDAEETPHE